MNMKIAVCAVALLAGGTGVAAAEMWEDYAPSKEVWSVTQVKVQPNKLDDYLKGLHQTWVSEMDTEKKAGVVTDYHILVNTNDGVPGANVLLMIKYADWAALGPNKERDLKIRDEIRKTMSKEKADQMVTGYNQYRTFVDSGTFFGVEFPK
jgi:hypothetical protein